MQPIDVASTGVQQGWTPHEKKIALATALSPLLLSMGLGLMASPMTGGDGMVLAAMLTPVAYLTLVLFVMPLLWLRKRLGGRGAGSLALTVFAGTFLPWWAGYALLYSEGSAKWAGESGMAAGLLAVPAILAALVAVAIDRWRRVSPL